MMMSRDNFDFIENLNATSTKLSRDICESLVNVLYESLARLLDSYLGMRPYQYVWS